MFETLINTLCENLVTVFFAEDIRPAAPQQPLRTEHTPPPQASGQNIPHVFSEGIIPLELK